MDLFYCRIDGGNFGDDMNAWFWDEVFPDFRSLAPETCLFGIGSLLGRDFLAGRDRVLVMGSGSGYGPFPNPPPPGIRYGWVRGPMTAENLGLPPDRALTDPAALVPMLGAFRGITRVPGKRLFVPHCGTERLPLDWGGIAARAGMTHLSPAGEARTVIREIASAELVVTESLHGAIVADAFRVPWLSLAISPTFSSFKWVDWGRSMDLDVEFGTALGTAKRLYATVRRLRRSLSPPRGASPATPSDAAPAVAGAPRRPGDVHRRKGEEYWLSRDEKARFRGLLRVVAPAVEWLIVSDLKRRLADRPQLSADAMLARRQAQMVERVEETRARLVTEAA